MLLARSRTLVLRAAPPAPEPAPRSATASSPATATIRPGSSPPPSWRRAADAGRSGAAAGCLAAWSSCVRGPAPRRASAGLPARAGACAAVAAARSRSACAGEGRVTSPPTRMGPPLGRKSRGRRGSRNRHPPRRRKRDANGGRARNRDGAGIGPGRGGRGHRGRLGRARRGSSRRRQQRERIEVGVTAARLAHAEMEVRPLGRADAGGADRPDQGTRAHLVAAVHCDRGEVEIGDVEAAVLAADADRAPRRSGRAREADESRHSGHDRRSGGPGDVDSAVLAGRVRIVAVPVGRDHLPGERPAPGRDGRQGPRQGSAAAPRTVAIANRVIAGDHRSGSGRRDGGFAEPCACVTRVSAFVTDVSQTERVP